jgi:hypothetical protein
VQIRCSGYSKSRGGSDGDGYQDHVPRTGRVRYRAQVRVEGVSESKTFSIEKAAAKWAGDVEREIDSGDHNAGAKQTKLAELLERYDRQVVERMPPKSAATARRQLRWWTEALAKQTGSKAPTLAQITPARIIAAREALEAEPYSRSNKPDADRYDRSPATVNRFMAALGRAIHAGRRVAPGEPQSRARRRQAPAGVVRARAVPR